MKILRIDISKAQPLNDVLNELHRIGYRESPIDETQGFIATFIGGGYQLFNEDLWDYIPGFVTTLDELKAMPEWREPEHSIYDNVYVPASRKEGKYKGD